MIMKLLVVIGVVSIVYLFFIKEKPKQNISKQTQNNDDVEDMIKCPTCGVYCEVGEMILSNGIYYCSKECIRS